jgi:uncharacterized membrane protein YkvA (DUF1232 family)
MRETAKAAGETKAAFALPQRYLEAAARPETLKSLRDRLPAKLRAIADNRLVILAKEAYGYATDSRIPTRYKVMAAATLLYFISPLDAVPDYLPALGYVDDAAVLTTLVVAIREATKAVITHTRDEANAVVTQAISEAREAWARRGVSQVCLSLWAATIAASVGLVYYGTRTVVLDPAGSTSVHDPFFWGCMLAGVLGLGYHMLFGYRVWRKYDAAPPEIKEPLAYAIVSLADWRQIVALALPVVILIGIIVLRAGFTLGR